MLYADLMLQVGCACEKWNAGDQTNDNFMFRRWLRKLSKTFDWKERRLQALIKALEAAAGSSCCARLLKWLTKRISAENGHSQSGKDDTRETDSAALLTDTTEEQAKRSLLDVECGRERDLLLERSQSELASFDKTTSELALQPGLLPSKQREKARNEILVQQEKALAELDDEYRKKRDSGMPNQASTSEEAPPPEQAVSEAVEVPLPITGSMKSVCTIASELIRHMLLLELYDGGMLAAEAVSVHLKERAAMIKARRKTTTQETHRPLFLALREEAYDNDDDKSESDSDVPLSDDDQLLNDPSNLIESMSKGALTPELEVLYGLSLIGLGGKNFVALKLLESIRALDREPLSFFSFSRESTSITTQSARSLVEEKAARPLGRIEALASIANILRSTGKEKELAHRVSPLFTSEARGLMKGNLIDTVLDDTEGTSRFDREPLVQVLAAAASYQIEETKALLSESKFADALALVESSVDILTKVLKVQWNVSKNGSVSSQCAQLVRSLSRAFSLLCRLEQLESCGKEALQYALRQMPIPVSLLCSCCTSEAPSTDGHNVSLDSVPLPSNWLTKSRKAIAERVFHLCVANNIKGFSGWKNQAIFSGIANQLGLTVIGDCLVGILVDFEVDLEEQWDILRNSQAVMPSFDFEAEMAAVRETTWYMELIEKKKNCQRIPRYGEDDALAVLLSYSRSCLLRASELDDNQQKSNLVFESMSILLPASQFCLKRKLWNSSVGCIVPPFDSKRSSTSATRSKKKGDARRSSKTRTSESRGSRKKTDSAVSDEKKDDSATALPANLGPSILMLARPSREPSRALHEGFTGENADCLLSNMIVIPCTALLAEWKKTNSNVRDGMGEHRSSLLMSEVNDAVRVLRSCYSEQWVRKSSVSVALTLLDVACSPSCENPFLCVQQAARFASHGPKYSDFGSKMTLPKHEDVTPLLALRMLGRAECLQSLYHCKEAADLCRFVASVCNIRRGSSNSPLWRWNDMWKVLGICAYNVSVVIRYTASTLVRENGALKMSDYWKGEIIEELKRGRADGLSLIPGHQISDNPARSSTEIRTDTSTYYGEQQKDDDSAKMSTEQITERAMLAEKISTDDDSIDKVPV